MEMQVQMAINMSLNAFGNDAGCVLLGDNGGSYEPVPGGKVVACIDGNEMLFARHSHWRMFQHLRFGCLDRLLIHMQRLAFAHGDQTEIDNLCLGLWIIEVKQLLMPCVKGGADRRDIA